MNFIKALTPKKKKEDKIKRFTYSDMQGVYAQVIMPLFAWGLFLSILIFLLDTYAGIVLGFLTFGLTYFLVKRKGFV